MDKQHQEDMFNFLQATGNAISDVFDQMLEGGWVDDTGHKVPQNIAMLRLKDVLETAIELNETYYNA